MSKTLSVSAISEGTVIDHITPGQTLTIINMLGLLEKKHKVTIGLNLSSQTMKLKDLIKIEGHILSTQEANEINVLAPNATINVIRNFEVVQKIITHLPPMIKHIFICPNPVCITHSEGVDSFFSIEEEVKQVKLICHYCEKVYNRNELRVKG